jgi:thymidylate synthase
MANRGEHFTQLYSLLWKYGDRIEIKGQNCIELMNYRLTLTDPTDCLTSFEPRKLNLTYCKKEWLWYLNGDRFDDSIEQYASMWKKIKQPDGGYNSNYGQYIFGQGQFDWVVDSLLSDPSSRQACIQLLSPAHFYPGNTDVVCTMGIQFMIRDGLLHMFVRMRSNDAIFGMTNDVFCFSQLHQMVFWALRDKGMSLGLGTYIHDVGSMHVYERHFGMLQELAENPRHSQIQIPKAKSYDDYKSLAKYGQGNGSEYAKWMLDGI